MKPRIKKFRRFGFEYMRFECRGPHPVDGEISYGYGNTEAEAYENWLNDRIPF